MNGDIRLTGFGVSALVSGLLTFWLIKTQIEPWVVETVCRELIKCN